MTHRIYHILVYLSFLAMGAVVALYGYWMFLDGTIVNPVSTHQMPPVDRELLLNGKNAFVPQGNNIVGEWSVQTDYDHYKPGDNVYGHFSVCLKRRIQSQVQWTFINDIVLPTKTRDGQLTEPGCYTNERVLITKIPDELSAAKPESEYRLYGYVEYQVNLIREIGYEFVTNSFHIVIPKEVDYSQ